MKDQDQLYADLTAAEEVVRKTLAEIDQALKSAPSREAGEKKVLEELVPRMDEAMRKSKGALDKWLEEIRAQQKEAQTLLQEEP